MSNINSKIFQQLPGCFLVVENNPDFLIVDVSDAYLQFTKAGNNMIGKPVFAMLEGSSFYPPAILADLASSFQKLVKEKEKDEMALHEYHNSHSLSEAVHIVYWKATNIPVIGEQGKVAYIIHSLEDVTGLKLLRQQLKAREKSTQQQIADAVSTTQELERMEIGRELHDNINQLLITSRLFLGRAISKKPQDKVLSEAAYDLIKKAIDEIKGISEALMSTSPQEEDLVTTLEELIGNVMSSGSIQIKKEIALPDESLITSKTKVTILRIVQEQLANVIKHSEAKNLFINVGFSDKVLTLNIKDDGKGFHLSELKPGMGFQNMKSRVAVMDGTLTIHSTPGDGCTIEVHLPFHPPYTGSRPGV